MPEGKPGKFRRFLRWLFGSPFQDLPPEFGNPVPPDLEIFEKQTEEIAHKQNSVVPPPSGPESGQNDRENGSQDGR